MENNNWRPAPPGGGGPGDGGGSGGEAAPEGDDWRKHVPQESRQRMPDYLRKISLNTLTMETKSQNSVANSVSSGSAGNSSEPPDSVPLDSTAEAGQANGGDWQEEIYQKIKSLKDLYLQDLNEMYQKIAMKLQQHDSLPQQPKSEQLEKLKIFKVMLERLIAMLQVPKSEIYPSLKDKLPSYEKQIVQFLNSNRPRMQQGQLPLHHMPSVQPQQSQPHVGQVQSRGTRDSVGEK
ncbi:hypothetical protein CDL15_Pgr022399 [Punica granatum]|uniref:Mediator of RNA polymerase II transcription subunit 15a-like n=1 Tax=Punica granatum TaxID=22663 RepID=A0A218XSQ0_PUNGR|nr:hypothetical protein CDL15_Pgr022399 [Punica granatum]